MAWDGVKAKVSGQSVSAWSPWWYDSLYLGCFVRRVASPLAVRTMTRPALVDPGSVPVRSAMSSVAI